MHVWKLFGTGADLGGKGVGAYVPSHPPPPPPSSVIRPPADAKDSPLYYFDISIFGDGPWKRTAEKHDFSSQKLSKIG